MDPAISAHLSHKKLLNYTDKEYAIIIKKEMDENQTDYKILSKRLNTIEIDTSTGTITIFQTYAPDSRTVTQTSIFSMMLYKVN